MTSVSSVSSKPKATVRFILFLSTLLLAGCGLSGGAPPREDQAAGGPAARVPDEPEPSADPYSEAILAEYARRFSEGYPLYPGDRIRFSVLGHSDLSFEALVPAEGSITYPLIGKLKLVGRTVEEIRQELSERLGREYLVDPNVTVLIQEYSKKYAYVLGAVTRPQEYALPSGQFVTLLQVVSLAGGFLEEAAKDGVLIRRRRQIGSLEPVTIPVNAIDLQEPGRRDPIILPDDIVFVPSRDKVYVLGQVFKPGAYAVSSDHPVLVTQLLSVAGGVTRIANTANVRLFRRNKEGKRVYYIVDVARILDGHPEEDPPVKPGDILFVPESFF